MTESEREVGRSQKGLAELLNWLLDVHRRSDGNRWSDAQVAEWCAENTNASFSRTLMWQLRTGRQQNLQIGHAHSLAQFFDVDVQMFAEPEEGLRQLRFTQAMRDSKVKALALRGARLSPESLAKVIAQLDELESSDDEEEGW